MTKKKPPYNAHSAIRGAVRRAFSRSPVVREVMQGVRREVPKYNKDGTRSKKDAVQYRCYVCSEWVSSTKIQVDHIEPVVDPTVGFVDWNTFIDRLFCDASNLSVVCLSCHVAKTNSEKAAAKQRREHEKMSAGFDSKGEPVFDMVVLKKFSEMSLEEAKTEALSVIAASSANDKNKALLQEMVNKSKTTKKLVLALSNAILANPKNNLKVL